MGGRLPPDPFGGRGAEMHDVDPLSADEVRLHGVGRFDPAASAVERARQIEFDMVRAMSSAIDAAIARGRGPGSELTLTASHLDADVADALERRVAARPPIRGVRIQCVRRVDPRWGAPFVAIDLTFRFAEATS